jgi:alkyl sulfatase BDS1-like metallo-beta-lactamase superfamily hydrolase
MTTDRFLDYLGIRMDARKAEGLVFKINFVTPDNGEEYVLELSNGALTNIAGYRAADADLTIIIDRSELDLFITGKASFPELVQSGKAMLEGDPDVFAQLQTMLVSFDGRFAIMPGTD